ncbi:hypothetical protein MMC12_007032, partial [Toensbergia leucococca]|nr:hypothetical protein [Toensbergia leucococca]
MPASSQLAFPPAPSSRPPHPGITANLILWLLPPPPLQIPTLPHAIYNHPVLTLSSNLASRTANILILTSFAGRNFRWKNETVREAHLPIYPSEAHPDSDRLLRLEGGTRLRRNSYVKIERVYEVDLELLGSYDDCGGVYRLAAESWEELVDCLNMGDCEGWDGDKEGSDKVHFDFMRLLELLGT